MSPYVLVAAGVLIVIVFLCLVKNRRSGKPLPPSPPSLPLIGHLHLIGSLPHVSLRDLAARHGRDGLMLLRPGAGPIKFKGIQLNTYYFEEKNKYI